MKFETQLAHQTYQVDRPLHHQLAMAAYRESFRLRNLTSKYEYTEMRRLGDVFNWVAIADTKFTSIRRGVDTFDLTSPHLAGRIREAFYRDLPSQARAIACFKAIDRYCRFLKECPTVHLSGQVSLYLPELYGAIESPVNRYTIPRNSHDKPPNRNYLEASEYKHWLKFTWSQIKPDLPQEKLHKVSQLHLMCVIAGETGIRLQEILGLRLEHFMLEEGICLVVKGKGNRGSGHRKRSVPVSPLVKETLQGFLKLFKRQKDAPLFQNHTGECLSDSTAHHWLAELIKQIRAAQLPIFIDKGFGWHAFRRTFTRLYLQRGGNVFDLKRITGWSYTSTISHYLGDSKQVSIHKEPPLFLTGDGHGD